MASVIRYYSDKPDCEGTAKFCEFMDKFFDCTNVKSYTEGQRALKPFRIPYTSINDERFYLLMNDFLGYLDDWKQSLEERNDANYTRNARARMYLSWQTDEGLRITVYSSTEATKFLLDQRCDFVLSERFCQEVIEEYFGRQRSLGRRNDNPTLHQFGYNDNTIHIQRTTATVMGNTRGAQTRKRKKSWFIVDNTPLKRRK